MNRALGKQATRSVQDATQACLRRTVGPISPIQTRAFSSGSVSKKQCKALYAGLSLAFLSGALASQTPPHFELGGKRLFGTTSSIFADEIKSASSSILRQASPAAARRPQTHLVFLTLDQAERDAWQRWIAYFRNEGFDCLLINTAVEGGEADHSRLGEELTQQLRLASLPVQPIVLVQNQRGAEVAFEQLSSDPRASGLMIVLFDTSAQESSLRTVSDRAKEVKLPSKLRWTLISASEADAIKQAEKWIRDQGFS
ncbi:hypothetical protein CBOM_04720 [Ceraceosorus bombacis]|uniref:Uncharacterized protein n=1 Tax=Ceraceosorus bombacis TaxID=401625 RepID=A0A0P1BRA0_9BASI|nr:hypothetical protein CBOM_04720 [Ceraceosorus bombacis]